MRAFCLSLAALALAACTHTTEPQATASETWECSPDATSRYRVDDDGMKLELCSAGCAVADDQGAVCSG